MITAQFHAVLCLKLLESLSTQTIGQSTRTTPYFELRHRGPEVNIPKTFCDYNGLIYLP